MQFTAAIIICLAVSCLAIWLIVQMWTRAGIAGRSRTWPRVSALVTEGRLHDRSDSDGANYSAEVMFTYEVNGMTYTRSQLLDIWVATRGVASLALARHPVGSKAKVRICPDDPGVAFIESPIGPYKCIVILLCVYIAFSAVANVLVSTLS